MMLVAASFMTACGSGDDEKESNAEPKPDVAQLAQWTTPELTYQDYSLQKQAVSGAARTEVVDGCVIARDARGYVTEFESSSGSSVQLPRSAADFFSQYIGKDALGSFRMESSSEGADRFEVWGQYAGDLLVSQYTLRFRDGLVSSASGIFVPLDGFVSKPVISEEEALFIYFHGQMPESDSAVADASLQAVLFPEGNVFVPRLVYCVTVHPVAAIHTETGSAWIDARTGRVVMLFPVPI